MADKGEKTKMTLKKERMKGRGREKSIEAFRKWMKEKRKLRKGGEKRKTSEEYILKERIYGRERGITKTSMTKK